MVVVVGKLVWRNEPEEQLAPQEVETELGNAQSGEEVRELADPVQVVGRDAGGGERRHVLRYQRLDGCCHLGVGGIAVGVAADGVVVVGGTVAADRDRHVALAEELGGPPADEHAVGADHDGQVVAGQVTCVLELADVLDGCGEGWLVHQWLAAVQDGAVLSARFAVLPDVSGPQVDGGTCGVRGHELVPGLACQVRDRAVRAAEVAALHQDEVEDAGAVEPGGEFEVSCRPRGVVLIRGGHQQPRCRSSLVTSGGSEPLLS